jgi:hypothetical protein
MNLPPFLTEQWASAYFQILFNVLVFAIGIPFLGLQLVVQEDVRHVVTYRTWKIVLWLLLVLLLFLSAVSFIWFLHPGPSVDHARNRETIYLQTGGDATPADKTDDSPSAGGKINQLLDPGQPVDRDRSKETLSSQTAGENIPAGKAAHSPPAGGETLIKKIFNLLPTFDDKYQAYLAGAIVTIIPILTLAFGYWLPTNYTRKKVIRQFRNDIVKGFNKKGVINKSTLEKIAYLGEHGNPGIEKRYVLDAYKHIAHKVQKKPIRFKYKFIIAAHERISAKWPEDKLAGEATKPVSEESAELDDAPETLPETKKKFHRHFIFFERLRERIPDDEVGYKGRELEGMIRSLIPILQYREKPGNDENLKQAGELLKSIWRNVSGSSTNRDAALSAFTLKKLGLTAIKENSDEVVLMYLKHAAACDDSVVFELGLAALKAELYKSATFALSELENLALAEGGGVLGSNETTYNLLGLAAHFIEAGDSGKRRVMRFMSPRKDSFSPSLKRCIELATDYHYYNGHFKTADQLGKMYDVLTAT